MFLYASFLFTLKIYKNIFKYSMLIAIYPGSVLISVRLIKVI
ncbi:hypothetical protein [Morganella morganii IS15]|nr:hypothetical protein [Morganella morganii IS15]